ncbi:MAG: hypothetical protein IKA20_05655 [Clostridia bacterium]|nr:hypothetical protein [Clostridia bacterium]
MSIKDLVYFLAKYAKVLLMDKKKFEKLRRAEAELAYAKPRRAAKLTGKIVKWKGQVFDE